MNHSRTRGRAVLGVGLWLHACWKCGFEFRWAHGCLSVGSVVCCVCVVCCVLCVCGVCCVLCVVCCQVQVPAPGRSFVQWCPRVTQCDLRRVHSSSRGVLVSVWPATGRFLVQRCLSIIQCDLRRTDSSYRGVLVSVWPATGRFLVQRCLSIIQCDLRRTDSSSRDVLVSFSVTCDGPIPRTGVS